MCEDMFYDSLEEDDLSPRSDHKEKEIDGYCLERKQHENTSIAHVADVTGPVKTFNCTKVPFYNTSVSLTAVRELRKTNNIKLKSRRSRVTSIPSLSGYTSNCSVNILPKKAKEIEAKSVVGRWLHNARNPECETFTKKEFNVNPHQTGNKKDMHGTTMHDIGDKFHSLSCDDHISKCGSIISSRSVNRSLTNTNTPLNTCSLSDIDSKAKLTHLHIKERSFSNGAQNKSYLERFYEKRYGPRRLMQRSLLVGSSICSTRGEQSIRSLSSVSNLSQYTNSVARDDQAEEGDYYRRLIENDIKRRNPQATISISETDNSEVMSKSESKSTQVIEAENCSNIFYEHVQQQRDVENKIYDWALKSVQHTGKSSSQEPEPGANSKPLTYVPYNIKDFKCLGQPKLGKLGPDLQAVKDKSDRMRRQREYGEIASSRNRELINKRNQSKNRRQSVTPSESLLPHPVNVNPSLQSPPSSVQTVPRATKIPRKKNSTSHGDTSLGQNKCGGGTEKVCKKDNASSNADAKSHPSLLEQFKQRHLREVQMAEAIRKELK